MVETTALSAHTGVAVRGVDLGGQVTAEVRAELQRLFSAHSVLVVRDQVLDPPAMHRAVRLFGELFVQHNARFQLPDCPEIHYLSNEDRYPDGTRYVPGAGYHTDHSNDRTPPKATVLYAVELPSQGGDTQFVNMHAAYEALAPSMQARLAGLRAEHVYQSRFSARKLMPLSPERQALVPAAVWHPLVRTHPESGRRALYLNPIRIERIDGMEQTEALALLEALLAHATQPCFEYRHRWLPGDFVMWDNRCLLHKANGDYDMRERRYLYRAMLQGETPR